MEGYFLRGWKYHWEFSLAICAYAWLTVCLSSSSTYSRIMDFSCTSDMKLSISWRMLDAR